MIESKTYTASIFIILSQFQELLRKKILLKLEKLKEYKKGISKIVDETIQRINRSSRYPDSEKYLENVVEPQIMIIDLVTEEIEELRSTTVEKIKNIMNKHLTMWESDLRLNIEFTVLNTFKKQLSNCL